MKVKKLWHRKEGWMDGWLSGFKDCLQQSITVKFNLIDISGAVSLSSKSILELLECPVCFQTPVFDKIYQCSNGHIMCRYSKFWPHTKDLSLSDTSAQQGKQSNKWPIVIVRLILKLFIDTNIVDKPLLSDNIMKLVVLLQVHVQ